jgi:hypothetical protein
LITLNRISVHSFADQEGSYEIYLEETNITVSDECDTAIDVPKDGTSILGSAQGSHLIIGIPSCVDASDGLPGIWYQVTGTGRSMTASTCQSSDTLFSYISIFSGDCGSLECEEIIQTPCGSRSSVTWTARANERYVILVQTSGVDEIVLYIEETTSNDLCSDAIGPLLGDNSPTFGSTRSATFDQTGIMNELESRGIWYTVIGSGR